MLLNKFRIYWIILLLLFYYTHKRYDIDEYHFMRYNKQITVDEIIR
jgi:hypothetical protein